MQKTIEIAFHENGEVQSEAIGFKGKGCDVAGKIIEDALGKAKNKRKKPEYHQQVVGQQKQRT